MKTIRKEKKWFAAFLALLLLTCPLSVSAAGQPTEKIPAYMQPYTILKYESPTSYKILRGGLPSAEAQKKAEQDQAEWQAQTAGDDPYGTAIQGELPDPVQGAVVTYASDGYLEDIEFPEGVENPLLQPMEPAPVPPASESMLRLEPEYRLIARWGSHGNELYCSGAKPNEVWIGVGRATTFSDAIGQANIHNYKGSVATSLKYDNCAVYTEINVRTFAKNGDYVFIDMDKTDAGSLPDAVIDIWKTGVEYFGYTYSSSFSLPKEVNYVH